MKVLVVIDMQNDFIDGSLGTEEAQAIVPRVAERIRSFEGIVVATRDTHTQGYLNSAEGKKLPVEHCMEGTEGWQIRAEIAEILHGPVLDKPSFGSLELGELLKNFQKQEPLEEITLIGLCTDICVISNAMILKAYFPEVPIQVDAACCAGVSPATHTQALEAMKLCQIDII